MNAISPPLDLLPHRPLAAPVAAMLREVAAAAQATGIAWFVGGASARDILLTHVYDIEAIRATADVDIGISIQSWTGHDTLRNTLIASGHFAAPKHAIHRLDFSAPHTNERTWLDIVPFGGVQDERGEIAWPPDQSVRMNVAGFRQALDAAIRVRIAPDLVAPVASLPAQAMLKIVAWQDRHASERKDAIDLLFLMARYAQTGQLDRLYSDAFDLVERHGHDPDIAGAALLGRDTAALAVGEVRAHLLAVLRVDDPAPPILDHMLGTRLPVFDADTSERIAALFDAFRQAFREAAP
ncbi:nucleotidyl transferase AbiEii/AbiGii toxin family protein [Caballeronia sp. LZ035]|uniref:nucleotidyl transferase AbiEii/AbiGii toxin family protein n=1 Tax=Caballeronia sp. LZ035 TaxID=3038568 RepID=UPI00285D25D3|nr:nucleotidyl transferase AbiEii/AbiGii toxin family protein [Caballeronia sp. LZ035]MDR5759808.1 nucleotidyl transferase AbiEii/AbiGii toxin family protein [Caballeronia sp. LZ035]